MKTDQKNKKLALAFAQDQRCFVCSLEIETIEEATLEHIIPKSLGGSNKQDNLAVSHLECNRIKGADLMRGYEPAEYVRVIQKHLTSMKETLDEKKKHLRVISEENDFMRRRIKELFGLYGYMNTMNHEACPKGFDVENFKKVHGLA